MGLWVRPGLCSGEEEVVTAVEGGGELAGEAGPLAGLAASTEEEPSAATIAGALRWGSVEEGEGRGRGRGEGEGVVVVGLKRGGGRGGGRGEERGWRTGRSLVQCSVGW